MTVIEQYDVAKKTNEFLAHWGLKKRFVAKTCGIPETSFYKFVNGKGALSDQQFERVVEYTSDYARRNS